MQRRELQGARAAIQRELQGAGLEVTDGDSNNGFLCDPQSMSDLHIVTRPGLVLRLNRNHGNTRGFVNVDDHDVEVVSDGC